MKYVKEVLNNPGLLPKIVVLIYRCGYLIYFKLKIPVIRQLCYIIYRLIDFVIVRLLLNCDLPAATPIGLGLTIYHPYGIIINSSAKIGTGLTIRAQSLIGNKGPAGSPCPVIGDNVDFGIGAKVIGDVRIGDKTKIGVNAVVTKSAPNDSILVGIPAHNIATK
ncbi:serine acetyltransferase [Limosilactobacillus vaginalis]|uniref:serine acetyltransferase n=1 Tax=Limosilactobacillus vaginalis TaxID=1633 RepID=UPI00241CCF10|nr:serine acetyltransferase [Limosilactobacillus vaginalis]